MRAKTVALCAAIVAVALTAASAAALPADELAPENESENRTVGVCVVGADSPCNGDDASDATEGTHGSTDETTDNGSAHDGKMWIPEDQNRDGEIDERFRGSVPELLRGLLTHLFGVY